MVEVIILLLLLILLTKSLKDFKQAKLFLNKRILVKPR
ncbi:hypothetical protein HC081234_18550 [Helicobacter cinaedi]|nr:hypothetical protein HC081234_18550 [Helicobacter cinaedi]